MQNDSYKRLFTFFSLSGLLLSVQAQDCEYNLGSTSFDIKSDVSSAQYYSVTDATVNGPAGVKIKTSLSKPDSLEDFTSNITSTAAIVTNPSMLNAKDSEDSQFKDMPGNMLVVKPQGSQDLFSINIPNVKKDSEFEVTYTLCNIINPKSAYIQEAIPGYMTQNAGWEKTIKLEGIKVGTNYIQADISCKDGENYNGDDVVLTLEDGCKTYTFKEKVDYGKTDFTFHIYSYYPNVALPFGIKDVKVTGCIDPKISSSKGLNICSGDITVLSLDRDYNASSYEWMMKSPKGEFEPVGENPKLLAELADEGTYSFCCLVDGMPSDTIKIQSITYCTYNGLSTSRKCIFNEDFGYFIDDHTYVDTKGNVSVTPNSYSPKRTNIDYEIPDHKFDSNDGINDGSYAIVVPTVHGIAIKGGDSYISSNYATWWANVTSDHTSQETGQKDGAAFLINVAMTYKGVVYKQTVEGLCPGMQISAESYIGDVGGMGSTVIMRIKDTETGDVIVESDTTKTLDYGWKDINLEFSVPKTSSSVTIEIESVGKNQKAGSDLVIDDIRLYTCTTPTLPLYTNLETLETSMTITEHSYYTLESSVTKMLKNYYGGKQKFIFQHSSDNMNWKNVAGPSSESSITLKTSDYSDTINYFRVIAASDSVIINEIDSVPNNFDEWDCSNNKYSYSVSNSVKVINLAPKCNIPAPTFITIENLRNGEGYLENAGPTLRGNNEDGENVGIFITDFNDYVIKSDENYSLLWSLNENGPWTSESPKYHDERYEFPIRISETDDYGYRFFVKQTDSICESEAVKMVVIEVEVNACRNIVDNSEISYYVDGQKLVVNAAEGSNVVIYTPLGVEIANKKMETSSVAFDIKGQSIVILNVDGNAYKVAVK